MGVTRQFRDSRRALAVLVVLLIAAFGLRVHDLGGPSVWHDEAWSIRAIRDPIDTPDDNTPPVYYAVMHVLWLGAGDSAFALRLGSVLIDLLAVALAVQMARRWAGWDAAILAAVLFGVSPLLWAYAREIRAYVAVPLLALVILRQTDALLRPRQRFPYRVWLGLLAAELILLYTHNLSVPVVAWLNVAVGAAWLWGRQWRALAIWVAGQAGVLVLYLPWLLGQSPSGTPLNTPPKVSLGLVSDIWQSYFAPVPVQIGADNALVIGSAIFGVAALASAVALLAWNRRRPALLVLSQVILLPVFETVELLAANIDFHPRYMIAGVPAVLLLVALGAQSVPDRDLRRLAVPATVALAWGVGAASLIPLFDEPRYQHDDFRALAEYYARLPEDALILIPYGWEPALDVYYAEKADIRAEMVGIDLHSSAGAAMAVINAALAQRTLPVHVELLTWYQVPADVRGMYPCLLESAGQRDGDIFTVQGITTTGYRIAQPVALAEMALDPVEYGAVTLADAALGGETALCLRTTWTQAQPGRDDWRAAARLLATNPAGWVVARDDGDVRRDDQALASEWEPDEAGEAYGLLRLPPGAPPGAYVLNLTVYSAQEPDGLDRLVAGVPSGRVTSLGTIRLAGATGMAFDAVPGPVDQPVADGVTLSGHDAVGGALDPGQELRITLYWTLTAGCCADDPWTGAALALAGDGWTVSQPVAAYGTTSLDWHALVVPAEASGPATLSLVPEGGDPVTLATYTVEPGDHLFAPPLFDVAVDAAFGDWATLAGFSVGAATVSPDEALDLTLVWRAESTAGASYRVFTHLLGMDGRVVAQHDGYPAADTRPTTGWVSGEYIVDAHALAFERPDYRGSAQLEVGLYDPETGERVPLANGADHVILPLEITVE